jgi:hypothetical protein
LEQYFNIKALRGEHVFTPDIRLTFKAAKSSDEEYRDIGNFHLMKVANTVMSENQFYDKLKSIYGEDFSDIYKNPLLVGARVV